VTRCAQSIDVILYPFPSLNAECSPTCLALSQTQLNPLSAKGKIPIPFPWPQQIASLRKLPKLRGGEL
jgi:hypothetical protein